MAGSRLVEMAAACGRTEKDGLIVNHDALASFGTSLAIAPSDQPEPLQAGMAVLADDDVVVDRDAERFCRVDDRPGHLDVGA